MFTSADPSSPAVNSSGIYAFGRVPVAFASCTDSDVSDGVEVRPQNLLVAEDFISECVQAVQSYPNICCGHPFLKKCKHK